MIRPGVPAPNLRPLMGPLVREHGGVSYHELKTRSLLNRCTSPRMPFRWTVNPYRGCAMGCSYCYATYTHEFMGIETPEAFHSTVYVKTAGEAETARKIPGIVRKGDLIALGTATDPYQPGEAEARSGGPPGRAPRSRAGAPAPRPRRRRGPGSAGRSPESAGSRGRM